MDCSSATPWRELYRRACAEAQDVLNTTSRPSVLAVDHCGQLDAKEVKDLCAATQTLSPVAFSARLWVGSLDCRYLEGEHGVSLVRNPKALFEMPDYRRDDLLRIYSTVGRRHECDWGEAILYFLHDWCGSDLALVEGIAAHFYGSWRENLYDASVLECLERWLATDPIVDEYRQILPKTEAPEKDYLQLLCSGGKVLCHAPGMEHETDQCLRHLYYRGLLTPNLIPGFYQFRNLTVKLLSMQYLGESQVSAGTLLRKSSHNRINVLLQDAEITLRQLLTRCFATIGVESSRQRLQKAKTEEQTISPELRKSLLDWAHLKGGADLRRELTRRFTEFSQEFDCTHNLWSRVCGLYAAEEDESQEAEAEPRLERIVDFLTFSELSNLILGLCGEAFENWNREQPGKQSPAKRWPAHLARLRRLRNQSAHLRNVTFQDMEDLLATLKEMRRDIQEYV
jgi:hypothetical protein